MESGTILDAWGEGIRAAYAGISVTDNPYPRDSKLAKLWEKGWTRVSDISHVLPKPASFKTPGS